jgi:hypothetical protein
MTNLKQNYEQLEAIGSAASSIAHDLNNQLMLAMNYIEFAEATHAHNAIRRCSSLTTDLLSICRTRVFEPQPIDPATFIRSFARSLRLPATCIVRVEGYKVLMPVLIDEPSLERAMRHIV